MTASARLREGLHRVVNRRHELGRRAEAAVAAWLGTRGWTVLQRRWRTRAGELDLICRDSAGVLVGVEVKLRTTGRAGSAAESVDGRRLARLRHVLADYASSARQPAAGLRLDLVTLSPAGEGRWMVRRVPNIDGW